MNEKYDAYKLKSGTFFNKKCKVSKNTIIVVERKNDDDFFVRIQGKSGLTKVNLNNHKNILEPIVIDDKCYKTLIKMPETLAKKKKNLEKLANKFKDFKKEINTLKTWIFSAKGSNDITYEEWLRWKKNPVDIITDSVIKGFDSKPGSPWFNRSQRNTPFVNDEDKEKWKKDFKDILPYGIRKEDYADFEEQEKIFDKLLIEFLSLANIPSEMIDFAHEIGIVNKNKIIPESHKDYITKNILNVLLLKQNEHHSKEKGLELCHIDPKLGTISENITISTCKSNREQGGLSREQRKCDGMRYYIFDEMGDDLTDDYISNINNLVEKGETDELGKIYVKIMNKKE